MNHKYYDWNSLIDREVRLRLCDGIKHLIDNGSYWTNSPKYQTNINVFSLPSPEWVNLKMSFIWSCFDYLGKEVQIKSIQSWSFMTSLDSAEDRNILWHHHNHNPKTKTVSGIFYLQLPLDGSPDTTLAGTEFAPNGVEGEGKYYAPWHDGNWIIYPGKTWHRPGKLYSNEKRFVVAADMEF